MIDACHEIFDLRRAQEWTAALAALVRARSPIWSPYRGQCLIHRAEIMQLHGPGPTRSTRRAGLRAALGRTAGRRARCRRATQLAELHRLRGEFGEAEECYQRGSRYGREPQPGLRCCGWHRAGSRPRPRRSGACVDEAETGGPLQAASPPTSRSCSPRTTSRGAARRATSSRRSPPTLDAPLLRRRAAHARGAVLLAEGDARAALGALRAAWAAWQQLDVPYEARASGCSSGSPAARSATRTPRRWSSTPRGRRFSELGAAPDLAGSKRLARKRRARRPRRAHRRARSRCSAWWRPGRPTGRSRPSWFISEKTVARHVSNIFTKLGLSTRAAATAYAYEHDLV